MTAEQERIRSLITDTVVLLCRNGLNYQSQLQVQGVIAITLDAGDVFVVHINRCFNASSANADSDTLANITQTAAQQARTATTHGSQSPERSMPRSMNNANCDQYTTQQQQRTLDDGCMESDDDPRSGHTAGALPTFVGNTPSPNPYETYFVSIEKVKQAEQQQQRAGTGSGARGGAMAVGGASRKRGAVFNDEVRCNDDNDQQQHHHHQQQQQQQHPVLDSRSNLQNPTASPVIDCSNLPANTSSHRVATKSASFSKITVTQFMCNECRATFCSHNALVCHQIQCHCKQPPASANNAGIETRTRSPVSRSRGQGSRSDWRSACDPPPRNCC